ncbi:MAG: hypothetical protein HOI66_00300 [Verrucomicrobia bacterium]|nr:hypothetical protein [Verrucomicrobiota bacterium]MDB4746464.1 hypothetical protein [Verrucomicrobiota bacterium]
MTITIICITGLLATAFIGWKIGQVAAVTAADALHLPVNRFGKIVPLTAALALAGGLTVGAWQASEDYFPPVKDADCTQSTTCSPCSACPSNK